jgi:nucleotide-binding universal stress UspA family protein
MRPAGPRRYVGGVKVLVATDGSAAGHSAVEFAARLAASGRAIRLVALAVGRLSTGRYYRGGRLRSGLPSALEEAERLFAERSLQRASREAHRAGARVRCVYTGGGARPIAETVAGVADREKADLIVVGRGGGTQISRWALGSISHRLVHIARRPVAVVHSGARTKRRPASFLVASDGSRAAREAVRFAARLARAIPRARLTVLTVSTLAADVALTGSALMSALGILPRLDQAEAEAANRILQEASSATGPLGRRAVLVYRRPPRPIPAAEVIVSEARRRRADLIVLGNAGRSAVNDLVLGSVAQRVLDQARIPVALVRARRV